MWVGWGSQVWTTALPEGSAQQRTAKVGEILIGLQSCRNKRANETGFVAFLTPRWGVITLGYHHPHCEEHHHHHKKINLTEAAHAEKMWPWSRKLFLETTPS